MAHAELQARSESTVQITVKSRAAELLIHSRRFADLNDRLTTILTRIGVKESDSPKDGADKVEPETDRLPAILTEAVCNNSGSLVTYEQLINIVETELA